MDSSDLEVSNRARNPGDVGGVSCSLNFNEEKHEMCIIILDEEDIYPDGIATTHEPKPRSGDCWKRVRWCSHSQSARKLAPGSFVVQAELCKHWPPTSQD